MSTLLELSARYIDEDLYEGPTSVNRVTTCLDPVAEGIGFIEAFSNVVVFDVGDGLVLFDTSLEMFGPAIGASLRGWSKAPVRALCYTHGHVDHVGGADHFVREARDRKDPPPKVIGHRGVLGRFDRYQLTNGYNSVINRRQFATLGPALLAASGDGRFGPKAWVAPDITFDERLCHRAGDLSFELRHARGETDDHLWAWVPERRALVVGDFVAWVFPNAGNPQKVQRYPAEWARALREMQALGAELLLPAHGLPVGGADRVSKVLGDLATVLESLVEGTLRRMNEGATLEDCLHSVTPPAELMGRPYLRPVYDEPEFVVRNIWRLYGGWYDGDPAHLKPPRRAALGSELADLCGGAGKLAERATAVAASDLRLACELIELATAAAPEDGGIHEARAAIYEARRDAELSLMAKGIYATAANESKAAMKG